MGVIFLNLLNMSITASWLILAVLGIRLLFRRIPKWITCLLWGVVAIRLIFPFSIESVFSLQPSAEPIRTSTMVEGELIPYVPSVDSNIGVVENTINPALAETFAYQETQSVAPLQIVTEIAGGLWLCGMVVLLILALVSMIKLRLCVREAVLYRENIYICDAVKSPFILGIIRPRIYLSSSLSEEEMAYIIAHESAHLKRKDHLWKPFGYLLLCIYWFNPLCWVAYIMLCKDIELACDEKVIRDMNFEDKKKYSRVLLSCATQRRLVMMCPLAFGEVGVKDRVKLVLNYKKPSFWIVLISMAACVVVAVCFLTEPKSDFSIADYKAISYREYQKLTGYDAEFYHALYYIGELPKTELSIVFEGDYDEDLAGAVLAEDAKAIRIQGRLSELFGDDTKQLSESELLKKISENYGNVISIDYREGAGTAYYVGDYYAHIAVAADTDDNRNTVFEIAVENQTKNEKIFSGSSSFWLIWEEEEPVKENENVENAKDDNGYIWLSDTVFISELEDLDGNGTKEYVEVDLGDESNNFYSHFKFYWNGEMIYEYEDPCRIDPCVAEYVDLDHDGEKEIFFSFAPRVNSMPLEEYIVLKQYNSSWKPLEMIHGETMMDNAFPLSVTKGDTKWQAVISCENLDESVTFDVESHYLDLKREFLSDNGEETEFTSQLVEWYETEFVDYPSGEICGNVSAWGIWNIEVGEYEGKTCLIATHGIQCYDKFDFWGEADVYFDYDEKGNTRFLSIQFRPQYQYLDQNKEAEERIYEGETPGVSYGDIAERYYTVGQYMKEVKDVSKAMAAAGDSYICDEYLNAMGSPEAESVYVLHDLNNDGIEEFFIGLKFNYDIPYYVIYDVYTWKDGRAYQLMRGIGYRNGLCKICENGVIEDNYSGSAWDGQTLYHILPEGGIELETIDSVSSRRDGTVQSYYHWNELIDENSLQTILEQYQPESVTYVDCNRETIEQLRLSGIRK